MKLPDVTVSTVALAAGALITGAAIGYKLGTVIDHCMCQSSDMCKSLFSPYGEDYGYYDWF